MADESGIEVSAAFAPEHIATTLGFAKVLPARAPPLEVERAVKIAGLVPLVPLDRLDASWALSKLASHVLALEAELERQKRQLGAWEIAGAVALWSIVAAFVWWVWGSR